VINLTKNDYGSISIDVSNVCTIEDMFPILKAMVEQHFSNAHLIPMGNGASQCKYCGASFLPSYTEQSTEPVKNTGQNPVNAEPGVDEELIEMLDEAQGLCLQEEYSINEKITVRGRFDKIKQLLTRQPVQVDGELLEKIVQEVNTEMSRIDVDTNSKEVDYFTNEAKERVKQLLQQKRGDK